MNSILKPRCFVVIDAEQRTYARYDGAQLTVKVQGEHCLTPGEVEGFRVDPRGFLGSIWPESAA